MFGKSTKNLEFNNSVWVRIICICVAALCVIGTIIVFSVTSASNVENGIAPYKDVITHILSILAGCAIVFALYHAKQIFNLNGILVYAIWGICVAGIVAVAFFGTEVNGAKRWIYVGSVSLQPSEFLKVGLLLMMVKIVGEYSREEIDSKQALMSFLIFELAPLAFLFFTQRDLGTTLICAVMILAVAYLGGMDMRIIVLSLLIAVGVLVAYFLLSKDFRTSRCVFLEPWGDGQGGYGAGYNIIRAFYAIASGGLFGVGIGNSHEKYDYLYAADNDFIYAIICEEMGVLGGLIVLICIVSIFFCCVKIAENSRFAETKLVIFGCGTILLSQSLLNIGCTVGVLPTTGKPLPFVSSGGSALLTAFVLLGIIFNAARNIKIETQSDRNRKKLEYIEFEHRENSQREKLRELRKERDLKLSNSRGKRKSKNERRR